MSDFLSSLTGKAQSALKSAGFSSQSNEPENGQGGGVLKSHAFESIHHQLRTFQQQYSSVSPIQKIVTTEKGVALDLDSLSSDCQAHSKELYLWGQEEEIDIKDVTDRLAWISFTEGTLARTLATKINNSRAPFKALRDSENTLNGRRNIRATLHNQIARIEHEQSRGSEQRLAELKQQLHQAEESDEPLEKEVELLKRKAVRDSEQQKWQAIREYAEKLLLLSQASSAVLTALPSVPSADHKYHGADITTAVRASLQQALDDYKPGDINLPLHTRPSGDLSRSDTRSFGETHAQELSRITSPSPSVQPSIPLTPPPTAVGNAPPPALSYDSKSPVSYASAPGAGSPKLPPRQSPTLRASIPPASTQSPPLNPALLNQAPAPIPIANSTTSSTVAPNPADPTLKISSVTPTVAETGVPQFAGSNGPGPASGSLRDLKQPSPVANRSTVVGQDTRGPYGSVNALSYGGASAPSDEKKYESAQEEKKRLEREERERVFAAGGGSASQPPADDADLPPYQE